MKRYLLCFTVSFALLFFCCLIIEAYAEKKLYDDFSGTYLDSKKWKYREFVREVAAGKLVLKVGNNAAIEDARNAIRFINPEGISSIECEITVGATQLDSGNDPISFARIAGVFYNRQALGGATGDIWAEVQIGDRGSGLEAFWEVEEALDDDLDNWSTMGSGTLISPGTLTYGTAYTVKLSYDENNRIEFTVAGVNHTFNGPVRQRSAVTQNKQLGMGIDADGGSGSGYVYASFDDVKINNQGTAYDDFSTALLDPLRWRDLEIVTEISGCQLRLNGRKCDERANVTSTLLDFDTPYLEAKMLIESGSEVPSGQSSFARIAGYLYNESRGPGSGQTHNGYEDNVWVQCKLEIWGDNSLHALVMAHRSDDANESSFTELFWHEFSVSVVFDTPYTFSIKQTGSRLVFKCNDKSIYFQPTTPMYKAYNESRSLQSRVSVDPGQCGYIKTRFDDIYVYEEFPWELFIPATIKRKE